MEKNLKEYLLIPSNIEDEFMKLVFDTMDVYVDWLEVQTGEFEKKIPFLTVVGTPGKGKTTFSRRFLDLPYSGRFPAVVEHCKESNRRYRVSCSFFHPMTKTLKLNCHFWCCFKHSNTQS